MSQAKITTVAAAERHPLAARLIYPLFMAVSMLAIYWVWESGMNPGLGALLVMLAGSGITVALEHWLPFTPRWNRNHDDLKADILHALVSNAVVIPLLRVTLLAGIVALGAAVSAELGIGFWPNHWPLLAQIALGLVLGEFCFYWAHRFMHVNDRGWSLHSIHHSSERLYWLNGLRVHPVQVIFSFSSFQAPLCLLGADPLIMVLVGTFHAAHGLMQHSNIDLKLGWLNWFVSGPELHRWHHSRVLDEANNNYGNNLIVWDVLFGTRFLPQDRPVLTDVGVSNMPGFPTGWWEQIKLPFRWRRAQPELAGDSVSAHEAVFSKRVSRSA